MKTRNLFISLLLIVAFVVLTPLQVVRAADTITMAFTDSPEKDATLKFLELIYSDAFQRLGREFAYKMYPMKRCGVMANGGEVDGLPARILNTDVEFPNLIRVEEPIIAFTLSAFAVNPEISLNGWDSLQGTSYKVEYILGSPQSEAQLVKVVPPERLSSVPTIEQALKKLQAGRTDIFVYVEPLVLSVLQSLEFKDAGIQVVGTMEEIRLYPFLHKKHSDLAPELAEVLKQMKEEGVFGKYRAQAAKEVGANK